MICIQSSADIHWDNVEAAAYSGEPVEIHADLLRDIDAGRERFLRLIAQGTPCYGVSTGLGKLASLDNADLDDREFVDGVMRARAAAIGDPLPKPVARAMLMLQLVNFLSTRDGVSAALCEYVVARLNDDFTPWVPVLGHGMAADTTANSHAFQTLAGTGYVIAPDGSRQCAKQALEARSADPYVPDR